MLDRKNVWSKYSELVPTIESKAPVSANASQLHDHVTNNAVEKLTKPFLESVAAFLDVGDDKDNLTPTMVAARVGHAKVVEQLIKVGGAAVNKKGAWNESTALMVAAELDRAHVCAALLALEADVNLRNSAQCTALMVAAELGHTATVQVMLSAPVLDKDAQNSYGCSALLLAASNGHGACVDALVSAGADLNLSDRFGKTALIVAAENGFYDIVNRLVSASADVNAVSKRGVSALMLAAAKGHVDVCKCLTRHGADVKAENADSTDNVLTYACFAGNAEIIVHLINLGARVSYTNASGDSVLMRACEFGVESTVETLLSTYSRSQVRPPSLRACRRVEGKTCRCRSAQVLAALMTQNKVCGCVFQMMRKYR